MKLPGNLQNMMRQAQQMQEKMQQEIALIRVEATAGGGMITVKMDGQKNLLSVKIDPEVAGDVVTLTHGGVNASGTQETGTTVLRADGEDHEVSPLAPGVVVATQL